MGTSGIYKHLGSHLCFMKMEMYEIRDGDPLKNLIGVSVCRIYKISEKKSIWRITFNYVYLN